MADIVYLPVITRLDIDPDRVLSQSSGKLDTVIVVGYDKDGNEYFASSVADGGTAVWLLERMKLKLLQEPDNG